MIASRTRSIAPLAAAAVLLIGCGGSDSDDLAAGGGDWCAFAAEAEEVDEVFAALGTGGADIEAGIKRVKELAERLPSVAPDEISDEARDLSDGALIVVKALEDADYDILDADLSAVADPELDARNTAANAAIDEFTQRECGRPFGSDDSSDDPGGDVSGDPADPADDGDDGDDGGFDPSAGTLREQLIIQFESIGLSNAEATCIADNLDFNDPAVQSGDVAAMLDVFGQCNISLDRLGELGGG